MKQLIRMWIDYIKFLVSMWKLYALVLVAWYLLKVWRIIP